MIKDNIKNYKNYLGISKYLDIGLEYLYKTDFEKAINGKYEIIKDKVFANIQDYNTKSQSQGKFEAHKKYIDIQYIVEGSEKIGYNEISEFLEEIPYNEEKDISFLKNKNNYNDFINLHKNDFAIFYPTDAHMPQISNINKSHVKKVVIKVIFN